MDQDFQIPSSLIEFEKSVDEGLYPWFRPRNVFDDSSESILQVVSGITFELGQREVTCIEEPEIFSDVFSLVKHFEDLPSNAKVLLLESLASNASCLPLSITSISSTGGKEDFSEVPATRISQLQLYGKCLKMYIFLLHWLVVAAERESSMKGDAPLPIQPAKGKQKKSKHLPDDWDWSSQRLAVVRPMASILETDLFKLYQGTKPEENLINLFSNCAFLLLESPNVQKDQALKDTLHSIISSCAVKYGQLESSVSSVVHFIFKSEQYSLPMAELVSYAEKKFSHGGFLGCVVNELSRTHPKVFVRETKGAKSVGDFLVAVAELQPKAVSQQISLLLTFLANEPYILRNTVVTIVGKLIVDVYSVTDPNGPPDAEISKAKRKDKFLGLLLQRVQDANAFTRSRVLQTWMYLSENVSVPLGHWNEVTKLAIGRLEDKAALVRKSALQLLANQMQKNPFGSEFHSNQVEASLDQWQKMLDDALAASEAQSPTLSPVPSLFESTETSAASPVEKQPSEDESQPLETQYDDTDNVQVQTPKKASSPATVGGMNVTKIRVMVASLKAFLEYIRQLEASMAVIEQLLLSSTATDVENAIQFLILARQFKVDGAEHALRKMLPLVFSQQGAISKCVEDAICTLYLQGSADKCAQNLANLTVDSTLGDLTALEALVGKFVASGDISSPMVSSLWKCFQFNLPETTPPQSLGALIILAMASKTKPEILSRNLQPLLSIGFGSRARKDALLARWTCVALQNVPDSVRDEMKLGHPVYGSLKGIIADYPMAGQNWACAAEQAVKAVFSLHPLPERFCSEILSSILRNVLRREQNSSVSESPEVVERGEADSGNEGGVLAVNVGQLNRCLYLVGEVALQHLVYVEGKVRQARQRRADEERKQEQARADRMDQEIKAGRKQSLVPVKKEEGINSELGVSAQADMELDLMQEKVEREIVSVSHESAPSLISGIAPFVAQICKKFALLQGFPAVTCTAVLTLCKLMAVDATFCEQNLRLLFTIASKVDNDAVRSNAVIALGDLAFRFPNLVEPWTEHMYRCLRDPSLPVRKNAVMVLSHLILNDMMKVKGHISELVLKLEDEDGRISSLTKLFFHEFAKKGTNPIYNLLPDILSQLSNSPEVSTASLRSSMAFLVSFIEKDKQMEGLVDKLCHRFPSTADVQQWRDIAFCLTLLAYPEKVLRKLADSYPLYKEALLDADVALCFADIAAKAKKFCKPEQKSAVEEFERLVMAAEDTEGSEGHSKPVVRPANHRKARGAKKENAENEESGGQGEGAKGRRNVRNRKKTVQEWEGSGSDGIGSDSGSDGEELCDFPSTESKAPAVRREGKKAGRANRVPLQDL